MRIALIGFGKWGRNYLSAINQSGIARVTQVLVRNPDRILADPLLGNARVTSTLEEIDCDAAIVATHPAATVGYAVHFLRKNIPVMLEKPAGLLLDDALLLQSVAADHPVPLLVSHQHLFSNVYQELKKRVNDEDVMQIETAAGNDGPYRDYSFIWDYAPHDITMILGLKNLVPKLDFVMIKSSSEHSGRCEFIVSFDDGSIANTLIWNDSHPKERLLIVKIGQTVFSYDDQKSPDALVINGTKKFVGYTPPLTNCIKKFLEVAKNGTTQDYRFGADIPLSVSILIDQIQKYDANLSKL
jgi:predicted dehydrogenase